MNQCTKRIVGILVGLIAWWFFLMQEEFAFYGIYSVVSYGIHEVSILIPLTCLVATGIWIFKMVKQLIRKKATKIDKWFLALLLVLLLGQMGYFRVESQKISVTMIVTVENINQQEQTITVVNGEGDEEQRIVLNAPDFFTNMLEVSDREYLATYVCYKNNPHKGKLSMMILFRENCSMENSL
ncbi:hypothetical protein [Mediterraneibacter gnavus]|uniref:hypothetical protein n=1 Tax=Mediterraneibacter gnavus TaxID=33038 RepID=UPI00232EC7F1|nr:hypothetical protein [Mediterraneibacter gnavus]MDB8711986.1 hypothetical protein [Mediterraneibacter gnavus]MDB8715022.1 hypothetical protein [Mediterraneibacter gnavus]